MGKKRSCLQRAYTKIFENQFDMAQAPAPFPHVPFFMEAIKVVYAVNTKTAQGKIHRLRQETVGKPRDKQRALCGWSMKASVSLVYFTQQVKKGCLCRKCFPTARRTFKRDSKDHAQGDNIEDE